MPDPSFTTQVARLCDEAGMDGPHDQPLRAILMTVTRAAQDAQQAAERVGREAGQRAGAAAGSEVRAVARQLLREVQWTKAAAVAGLVVLSGAAGWVAARQVPVSTTLGRLTPAQMETLRWNDLGAALNACAKQAPSGGRGWCALGWWLEPPPPPV